LLASGSDDNTVRLWRREEGAFVALVTLRYGAPVQTVRFSADEASLAVLCKGERGVRLWDLKGLNESLSRVGLGWPSRPDRRSRPQTDAFKETARTVWSFDPPSRNVVSGSKIFLRTHEDKFVHVMETDPRRQLFAARRSMTPVWQGSPDLFAIHKDGGGQIEHGDTVYFQTGLGTYWSYREPTPNHVIHALADRVDKNWESSCELFKIYKLSGDGPILSGDQIYLQSRPAWVNFGTVAPFPVIYTQPSVNKIWGVSFELAEIILVGQ
jgi:WD40 repeat protein